MTFDRSSRNKPVPNVHFNAKTHRLDETQIANLLARAAVFLSRLQNYDHTDYPLNLADSIELGWKLQTKLAQTFQACIETSRKEHRLAMRLLLLEEESRQTYQDFRLLARFQFHRLEERVMLGIDRPIPIARADFLRCAHTFCTMACKPEFCERLHKMGIAESEINHLLRQLQTVHTAIQRQQVALTKAMDGNHTCKRCAQDLREWLLFLQQQVNYLISTPQEKLI